MGARDVEAGAGLFATAVPGDVVPSPQLIETVYWLAASGPASVKDVTGPLNGTVAVGEKLGADTTGATSEIVAVPIPLAMLPAVPVTTTETL